MIESPHSVDGSATDGQSYDARCTPGTPSARTGRSEWTESTGVVMGQHWALIETGMTVTFVLDACSGFGSAGSRRGHNGDGSGIWRPLAWSDKRCGAARRRSRLVASETPLLRRHDEGKPVSATSVA